MSADNYLYVRRNPAGGWCVTEEFASDDEPQPVTTESIRFAAADKDQCEGWAWNEDYPGQYEYGVILDDESMARMRKEKAADRQAVADAVERFRRDGLRLLPPTETD